MDSIGRHRRPVHFQCRETLRMTPHCVLVLNALSSRNVPGCGGNTEGYVYSTVPTHLYASSQQPQVQVGRPRLPPPPPPRNFPTQPTYPNLNGNQVPRSLVTYQSGTGHDNRPLLPEAFPQEAFPPSFPVTHAHACTPPQNEEDSFSDWREIPMITEWLRCLSLPHHGPSV
jgi:hypothetical protein